MSEIVNSYHNALSALRNAEPAEVNEIVYYTETKEYIGHGNADLMKLFSSLVYSKQFSKARQLLSQLNAEYLRHENTQTESLRQNALTNLLADTAYMILPKQQAKEETDALFKNAVSQSDYLLQVDVLLKHLQGCTVSQNDNKVSIAAQARQYIEEHFTDPMLGLYMVSDQLGISNSYLSSTFKKIYGVNVIQYINQLRIEQAKILILNTKKNIKEIAQDVGFSSDINFIRVFKKMENQTPSMLRKQISAAPQQNSALP